MFVSLSCHVRVQLVMPPCWRDYEERYIETEQDAQEDHLSCGRDTEA